MEEPDKEKLQALFEELEFRNFAKRIFSGTNQPAVAQSIKTPASDDLFSNIPAEIETESFVSSKKTIHDVAHTYHLVDNESAIDALIGVLSTQQSFCFDTETTGLDANISELVGMSFSIKAHEGWFVPLPANYHECLLIVKKFKSVFADETIQKIGQNIKFDIAMLRWYDIEVKGPLFDTMLAHYLIEPEQRHNMDYLSQVYLGYAPVPIEDLIGKKGKNQGNMRDVPLEVLKEYATEDADVTFQLKNTFEPLLVKQQAIRLFNETEMPLVPVLASMEAEGVRVDIPVLTQIGDDLGREILQLETDIFAQAGTRFNIASPKQMGDVLFEKLGLETSMKKTKTGQYPTGEEVLSRLVHSHPIVPLILDYRSLTKLKSTYVDTLPGLVNPRDGRVHTSYNQAVAATGRLSSNNPNLQNIPIRTERGREIRKAFVPRNADYTLLAADYSQIELRIIASLSGDEGMTEAFNQGLDIHTATASRVYGIALEEVSRDMRRNAKMVNFGIIYGISAFGLSERLGIPRREAGEIIGNYFREYPGVKAYMNAQIEFARKNGFVETILGRRRWLRDINASNSVVRGFAERNAINAPIQGSSADMIKIAMIHIFDDMQKSEMQSKMILQVHDELVFDAKMEELDALKKIVAHRMQSALPLKVPVLVEMNTGNNWLEAH
jgi:DNA polymerase-1